MAAIAGALFGGAIYRVTHGTQPEVKVEGGAGDLVAAETQVPPQLAERLQTAGRASFSQPEPSL